MWVMLLSRDEYVIGPYKCRAAAGPDADSGCINVNKDALTIHPTLLSAWSMVGC
jgi:hypothetical protein